MTSRKRYDTILLVIKMRLIDLTGKRFGKLIVIKKEKPKNKHTMWLCKCDCGKEKIVCGSELKRGTTKSCGCYNIDVMVRNTNKNAIIKIKI